MRCEKLKNVINTYKLFSVGNFDFRQEDDGCYAFVDKSVGVEELFYYSWSEFVSEVLIYMENEYSTNYFSEFLKIMTIFEGKI